MATKIYKFYGTCKWAKVQPDQLDENYDKKSKSWKLDMYMTPQSWENYTKSGLQLKVKEDKESKEKFVGLRRQERTLFKDEVRENGAPYVVNPDGVPIEEKIGNGSKICAEVEVYDSRNGKGHRLVGITVHEHIPFTGEPEVVTEDVPW